MNAKKFLISGILAGIVIWIISFVFDSLAMMSFPYNIMDLGGMRSINDPLMLLFFAHYWVISFVIVNDDASVSRLKGPKRPINKVQDRMLVLAALGSVDWVALFSEDTPERLIKLINP